MTQFLTLTNIIITVLVALLATSVYIINNLLVKVEKYEDVKEEGKS